MPKKKATPAHIKRHFQAVSDLGCIVTGTPNPTIHHCHSGSIGQAGIHRGMGQKPNDWLVIGLRFDYHVGNMGIDSGMGVITWESKFGKQIELLDKTCIKLGYNVYKLAGINRSIAGLD